LRKDKDFDEFPIMINVIITKYYYLYIIFMGF